jgi:hypothetical protein
MRSAGRALWTYGLGHGTAFGVYKKESTFLSSAPRFFLLFYGKFPGFSVRPPLRSTCRWNWIRGDGMILTGQNRITLRGICPNATLSTTNLTWTEVGSNACLLDERPATNRLRRGTDFRRIKRTQIVFRDSAPTSKTAKFFLLSKTNHLMYFRINSSFMSKIHSTSNIQFLYC